MKAVVIAAFVLVVALCALITWMAVQTCRDYGCESGALPTRPACTVLFPTRCVTYSPRAR